MLSADKVVVLLQGYANIFGCWGSSCGSWFGAQAVFLPVLVLNMQFEEHAIVSVASVVHSHAGHLVDLSIVNSNVISTDCVMTRPCTLHVHLAKSSCDHDKWHFSKHARAMQMQARSGDRRTQAFAESFTNAWCEHYRCKGAPWDTYAADAVDYSTGGIYIFSDHHYPISKVLSNTFTTSAHRRHAVRHNSAVLICLDKHVGVTACPIHWQQVPKPRAR